MNVNELINKIKEVAMSQPTVYSVYDGDVYAYVLLPCTCICKAYLRGA